MLKMFLLKSQSDGFYSFGVLPLPITVLSYLKTRDTKWVLEPWKFLAICQDAGDIHAPHHFLLHRRIGLDILRDRRILLSDWKWYAFYWETGEHDSSLVFKKIKNWPVVYIRAYSANFVESFKLLILTMRCHWQRTTLLSWVHLVP